ncbi:MAG: hypothetical protein K2G55_17300 [Lachnospiraceae bacterium]|nr:hypothetical protein [Lachnospiraceae bacterium]MDE7201520.1 hypothetical protein [Lachnospiraceae bacterium]
MQNIEIYLERRKAECRKKSECANDREQYARALLDSTPDREGVEREINNAMQIQAVNDALVDFIDDILDKYF